MSKIITPEQSKQSRKKAAQSTGEADTARRLSKAFFDAKPSPARHRYEFEGVQGKVSLTHPQTNKEIKTKAIFWYNGRNPRITLIMGGQLKVVSLIGRPDKNGLYTKFSILKSNLKEGDEALTYLK